MASDEAWLATLGATVLVVAPHPDDESLGCGGLIARLRERDVDVAVVLVSDGTMSHPASREFSASARRTLRESEMRAALACLGADPAMLHRLDCPDNAIPGPGEPGFDTTVRRLEQMIVASRAETLVGPWRRDPHRDHRAAAALVDAALRRLEDPPRLLEYGVWLDERGSAADRPACGEVREHRLDVAPVRERKAQAIAAHASQHGRVIVDDPSGFTLSPSFVERLLQAPEVFYEVVDETVPPRCRQLA